MAAQNRHSQDSMTQDAAPQSLYELLIYDNKKLVSKTEGPHIIMRRALKGSTVDIVFDQRTQPEEPSKDQDEDQQEEIRQDTENKKATSEDVEHEENEQPSLDVSESTKEGTDYTEMVSADTISSYLASLANHGQSDVLRVVDAITELEEAESVETGEENEELPSSKEEQEVKGESKGKKVLKIADIFDSLKKARRKAQQKNYSYTKKVEYEDH
ncbi:MAG: hypothetical protein KTR29_08210 [Rhodothermaceae bacterium]|nr:hypothetical protein [Rhodothermaceae bacterium]